MNVWNGIESHPVNAGSIVATIGNYDGVHLGHQAILHGVVEDARARGARSFLITFDPHPVAVVAPQRGQQLLQTRGQKLESLQATGLTDTLILKFNTELAALTGEQFFDQLLGERVALSALHVGENFRFGQGRRGDLELLRRIGSRRGFEVHGVAPVLAEGQVISSTAIRRALAAGDVKHACNMLGRPYAVVGEVVPGAGRGRSLNCPTANLELENEVQAKSGVYVTEARVIATRFPSVSNVGVRPTFDGDTTTVETHLLDFHEDLYRERLELRFLERLRDEIRFDSAEDLADQLSRDRAAATAFFQHQPIRS